MDQLLTVVRLNVLSMKRSYFRITSVVMASVLLYSAAQAATANYGDGTYGSNEYNFSDDGVSSSSASTDTTTGVSQGGGSRRGASLSRAIAQAQQTRYGIKTSDTVHAAAPDKGDIAKSCSDAQPQQAPREREGKVLARTDQQDVVFSDLSIGEWYAPFVANLIEKGIVSGYKDENGNPKGEFAPAQHVSIAEVTKMAMEAFQRPAISTAEPTNVYARGTWAAPYIAKAEELRFPFLTPNLNVHQPATRAQTIRIFTEIAELDITPLAAEQLYTDVPASLPEAPTIVAATELCWVQGDTGTGGELLGTFRPASRINRAETAKIMTNILRTIDDNQ